MLNSFIYMFKDKGFGLKYLSLFCAVLTANLLINWSGTFSPVLNGGEKSAWYYILFFAGFVVMFIPYGHSISILQSRLSNNSSKELPKLSIIENFTEGAKVVLAGALLMILLIAVTMVIFQLNSIFSNFLGEFFSIVCNIAYFLILITIGFMGIAMCCRYVVKPSFFNFINFKAAAELINQNVSKYFKAALVTGLSIFIIYFLAMISVSFLSDLGYLGLVIYCIIVSILWTYEIYVMAELFSQAVIAEKI